MHYIVCPFCEESLDLKITKQEGPEIIEGELSCKKCRRAYPITRAIPRIIPEAMEVKQYKTANAFGYQWKKWKEMSQLYTPEFLDYLKPLPGEALTGKLVLDAGCGMGRLLIPAAGFKPKALIGFDLSEAVEVAYENAKPYPFVHIIQGDIYNPPFRKNSFDFIYSIAVLHHLPDPKKGFLKLVEYVKPKGTMFTWVYGHEGNEVFLAIFEPFRKYVTVFLPRKVLEPIALFLAALMWLIVQLIYKPLNFLKIGGFLPMNEYLIFQTNMGFRYLWLTTFDKLVAPVVHYHRRNEIEQWFAEAPLDGVEISWRNKNSWRGYGSKK